MRNLREKTISGFIYKFLERIGAKGVSFVVSIILARILLPAEFGIIALVTVFIAICDVFVTYGFGSSLIADKNADNIDFSTCFYFGVILSLIVYSGVYFGAVPIAKFFENEILIPVIRVMALRIPIAAINSVQHAYVSKHMIFKKFFYSTLIGTVISGMIAIVMAYKGFGVWALVGQYLGNVVMDTVVLWIIVGWRPQAVFSFQRLKKIYSYGWKILAVGLIDTGYNQLRSLIIGKKYTAEDLAYYDRGMQFPAFGMTILEPTINGVLFPALSQFSDNQEKMKSAARRMIKTSTFLIFPIMIGLAVVGKQLIVFLLTDKWVPSVSILMIGCIAYSFRPIQIINNSIIKASGRSDLLLQLDILKKSIGVILLLISMWFGTIGIAISLAVSYFISAMINIFPNRDILNYGYKEQVVDIGSNLLLSMIMGGFVWAISFINLNPLVLLFIQIIVGIVVYVGIAYVVKNESFYYLLNIVRRTTSSIMRRNKKQ